MGGLSFGRLLETLAAIPRAQPFLVLLEELALGLVKGLREVLAKRGALARPGAADHDGPEARGLVVRSPRNLDPAAVAHPPRPAAVTGSGTAV